MILRNTLSVLLLVLVILGVSHAEVERLTFLEQAFQAKRAETEKSRTVAGAMLP